MKKSFVLLSVLVILAMVLTACNCVQKGNIIQMFSAGAVLYYPQGRNLEFLGYRDHYAEVLVDGNLYRLTDPENNSYVIVGKPGTDGVMGFSEPIPLLNFRDEETANGRIGMYQAFFSGYDTIPDAGRDTFGMLIINNSDMPEFVSQRLWNETKTELCVWEYPQDETIVQNVLTGEITHVSYVNTINDVHVWDSLAHGQCFSGYVLVDVNDEIYITQSEPDLAQMNLAYEKTVELFGVAADDAIEACTLYANSMVHDYGVTKEQISSWCGVYSPDMSGWK